MIPRRKTEGFNLAFLDIMSCGLGAIILVFMLVKFNAGEAGSSIEEKRLEAEIQELTSQEKSLDKSLSKAQAKSRDESKRIEVLKTKIAQINDSSALIKSANEKKKFKLASIVKGLKKTPNQGASDIVENKHSGEEEYLLGLKVEGTHIGILLDSSASMTSEKLIQIIRLKSSPDHMKQKGVKWIRSKKVIRWLIARLPRSAKASVISFNQNVDFMGGFKWFSGANLNNVKKVYSDIDRIVPTGATNLQKGLEEIKNLSPSVTDLYIVTDGLPTTGTSSYSSLNPFAQCSSLLGKSSNISGECRKQLFRQSVRDANLNPNITVNVILLPLEGDPEAAPEFWGWTSYTGGLLISPAPTWP